MSRAHVLIACALAAAAGIGTPLVLAARGDEPSVPPRSAFAVQTALPGLGASPKADVVSVALPGLHPRAGGVERVPGPFDDRFALSGVALHDGVVTGMVTVTSDVSEVIELQVLVGFYDAAGHFLGSGTFIKHGENAADVNEWLPFRVAAPGGSAASATSAALGVPVLVNE